MPLNTTILYITLYCSPLFIAFVGLSALCYGSTSCLNNHNCVSPDSCSCGPGYSLPRCAGTWVA